MWKETHTFLALDSVSQGHIFFCLMCYTCIDTGTERDEYYVIHNINRCPVIVWIVESFLFSLPMYPLKVRNKKSKRMREKRLIMSWICHEKLIGGKAKDEIAPSCILAKYAECSRRNNYRVIIREMNAGLSIRTEHSQLNTITLHWGSTFLPFIKSTVKPAVDVDCLWLRKW